MGATSVGGLVLFALSYILAARLGENLALIPGTTITFWPPAGLFLAVLLSSPKRTWAAVTGAGLVAELVCNVLWFHSPLGPAVLYFGCNAAEALVAAVMVQRLSGGVFRIERLRDVCLFAAATLIAPIVGATGISLVDMAIGKHTFFEAWPLVYLGDSTGLLVSAPLTLFAIYAWRDRSRMSLAHSLEAVSLSLLLVIVSGMAFRGYLPTPFLAMPFLLWASVRFRLAGAAVAIAGQTLLIALLAVIDRDRILIDPAAARERIVLLQVYLAVSSVSSIIVAALASQYQAALSSLKSANVDLESTVRDRTTELESSEARLRLFIEKAPAAIAMFDQDRRYLEASQKWKELFGLANHVAGARHDESPFGDSEEWSSAASQVNRGQTVSSTRDQLRTPDGRELWVKWDQQPWWRPDGTVGGVLVSVEDITDHVEVERTLREADRRKDEFLAVLAHELRNPLAPIRTGLDVIKVDSDPELREEVVGMMDRQLEHLVTLVDDLLDISRLTRGKIELRLETVDLGEKVRRAVEAARGLVHDRRHHLTVDLPPHPVYVRGDRVRLVQVLVNVLSNAAKYTPTGGQIALSLTESDGVANVTVSDTGVGLDADDLKSIWEMFGQSSHRDHSAGGLGIGLALVRNLVTLHQGRVWAESDGKGRGARFIIELPLTQPETKAETPRAPQRIAPGIKVLLIEDNLDILAAMKRLLVLQGADVVACSDGPSALELASEVVPDVVLCDIGMPVMSGLEVGRRLRQIPALERTLLIALTGYGSEVDRLASREAGFDRHLTKPVSGEMLTQALSGARDPLKTA